MREIDKKFDSLFIHFFLVPATNTQINLECNSKQYQRIADISQRRTPPRCRNINPYHLHRGILPVLTGAYFKCILTGI